MLRFLLAPRWLALHVATVLVVVGFVALGWWQLQVFRDSQDRHDLRVQAARPIDELVRPGAGVDDAVDRAVVVEGTYLADEQLLVPGRALDDRLGALVLTPVETTSGVIVPVVRGWVDDRDADATRVPQGTVRIEGYVLPPETAERATIRSDRPLAGDEIAFVAPEPFADATGLAAESTVQGYVLLTAQRPESEPAPRLLDVDAVAPIRDVSPWQNLSYWAQWWVFAAAALVFWASIVRSGLRRRRQPQAPVTADA